MSSTTAPDSALAGRSAVITGASRGIGLHITLALHAHGARVIMLGRDVDALGATARRLGDRASAVPVDLARSADVARACADLRTRVDGTPDIVVNNAAQFFVAAAEETTVAEFERTLDVNVTAHFALLREFLPDMRRRGRGHVVTIGSVADHTPLRGNIAYGTSKYALRGMHEVLREELRGTGVRTTLVSPARVDTSIWDGVDLGEARPDSRAPRPTMLAAEDVAAAVLFAVTRPDSVNVDELRLSRA